ncbi:MAG: RidA family protein [Pseudomonadota bacterium]
MPTARRHDPFPVAEPYHGIYAHGVELAAGVRTLHVSGQIGIAPDGSLAADFNGQCRQAIENLKAVLKSADMTVKDVVKLSFFLTRPEDMDELVNVRREFFDGVRPAITTVFVAGLVSPDWLVEVEAIAAA